MWWKKNTVIPKLNNKASSIISAMMLALVTSISIAVISSKVPWGYKFKLGINSEIAIEKLMTQTSNFVLLAIKNRWCFKPTLYKQSADECNLKHDLATERILINKDLSNSNSSLSSLQRMIVANNTTEEGRESLTIMGLPHNPTAINSVFLDEFTLTLDSATIQNSALKDLFSLGQGVSFTQLVIKISRDSEHIIEDRETAILLDIKLTATIANQTKEYHLASTNLFFPRELNSFALISARDLWLRTPTTNSPPANLIANSDPRCKPDSTKDSIITVPASNTASSKALVFHSPVYVNGDVHLPESSGQVISTLPISFSSLVLGNKGKLTTTLGAYKPNFKNGLKNKDSLGSLFSKVQVEEEDKGLSVLSGKINCKDGALTSCELNRKELTLGKMIVKQSMPFFSSTVSAGYKHTCAITNKGKLECWGSNSDGQINIPTGFDTGVKSVSIGIHHTCALKHTGQLECWGRDDYGRATPSGGFTTNIKAVSVGRNNTCAIKHTGQLGCWGRNIYGRIYPPAGFTTNIKAVSVAKHRACAITHTGALGCWGSSRLPKHSNDIQREQGLLTFNTNIIAVATGLWDTCAINSTGKLKCWGTTPGITTIPENFDTDIIAVSMQKQHVCAIKGTGELKCWGHNSASQTNIPVNFRTDIIAVSAGGDHTCAIKSTGTLNCWGFSGSLPVTVPQQGVFTTDFAYNTKQVSTWGSSVCAIIATGKLKCWGSNYYDQRSISARFTTNIKSTATGYLNTCAIKNTGQLKCWGYDHDDQTSIPRGFTTNIKSVSIGRYHICAIKNTGELKCWGQNTYSQTTLPSNFTTNIKSVSSGYRHSCAIKNTGELKCWGYNNYGQTNLPSNFTTNIKSVFTGYAHVCAIKNTGELKCWGYNYGGQINIPSDFTTNIKSVAVGNYHTCAVNNIGELKCWGLNVEGQTNIPSDFTTNIKFVSSGSQHTCAINSTGKLKCWGKNDKNQLNIPVVTKEPAIYAQHHQGFAHSCAILKTTGSITKPDGTPDTENGELRCWGNNKFGQIGNGVDLTNPDRQKISNIVRVGQTKGVIPSDGLDKNVTYFALGGYHSCAIIKGQVKCWGKNHWGQLGDNTQINKSTPVSVVGLLSTITQVSAGENHTCALTETGQLYCWGGNHHGQLGDSTVISKHTPVLIAENVSFVSAGGRNTCAIQNKALKCWGQNQWGQVGNGNSIQQLTPTGVIGLDSGVSNVSTGIRHTCAMHNQTIKCWGYNRYGQLGNNRIVSSSAPVPVILLTQPTGMVETGGYHTCAIDRIPVPGSSPVVITQALKCWGNGNEQELGGKVRSPSLVPILVPGLDKNVVVASLGDRHSCAVKTAITSTDETRLILNCWGNNNKLQVDGGQAEINNYGHAEFTFCPVPSNNHAFDIALWTTDFSPYSKLSWEFTDQNLADDYTLEFTDTASNIEDMPVFSHENQIRAIIPKCVVKPSATLVTGLYFCDKFIIEGARTKPLQIIGTVITNRLEVDPQAVNTGITWSAFSYSQAIIALQKYQVLVAQENNPPVSHKSCRNAQIFQDPFSVDSRKEAYNCSSSSIIARADPFRWTTVDPDCGVLAKESTNVKCKKHFTRFTIKQIKKTTNY